MRPTAFALTALALALAACASKAPPPPPTSSAATCLLGPFSRSGDGAVTRADMEAGIAAGFRAADTNANGNLEFAELQRWNVSRAQCDQTELLDWSGTGKVGIAEYGARYHSAFDQSDENQDGIATLEEQLYAKPKARQIQRAPMTPSSASPMPTSPGGY